MPNWPPETILIVDDNEIDLRLHKRVLKRGGYEGDVVTCSTAEAALAWLGEPGNCPVDLILLDINMPRMDGFEMLEAADHAYNGHFAEGVVIMLTTSLDPRDRTRAESFGVVKDYFDKPLTADRVARLLSSESLGGGTVETRAAG